MKACLIAFFQLSMLEVYFKATALFDFSSYSRETKAQESNEWVILHLYLEFVPHSIIFMCYPSGNYYANVFCRNDCGVYMLLYMEGYGRKKIDDFSPVSVTHFIQETVLATFRSRS